MTTETSTSGHGNRRARILCTIVLLLTLGSSMVARAAGFDTEYTVHSGDINSNGLTDLYLKRKTELVFVNVGDILTPIVLGRREVGQFFLNNQGDGTFTASYSAVERACGDLAKQVLRGTAADNKNGRKVL